jgi:hypothetical protein
METQDKSLVPLETQISNWAKASRILAEKLVGWAKSVAAEIAAIPEVQNLLNVFADKMSESLPSEGGEV